MKKFSKIALPLAAAITLSALPLLSLAAPAVPSSVPDSPVKSIEDVVDVLDRLGGWMFAILMIVAVMFILYAAFVYLTAGGDPEKVKTASNQLIYAAVAIAVALVAQGVFFIVEQLVGK
ncbi:MAG: hypothetical protein Q8Q41_00900 [bacterium]|nr:hypothetical protein [bacterium]